MYSSLKKLIHTYMYVYVPYMYVAEKNPPHPIFYPAIFF